MAINAKWHAAHPMPKPATLEQRVKWHQAHAKACGCRPVPASVQAAMNKPAPKRRKAGARTRA